MVIKNELSTDLHEGRISVVRVAVVRLDTILSNNDAATIQKSCTNKNFNKKRSTITVCDQQRKEQKYQRNTRTCQHKQKFSDSINQRLSANPKKEK